MLKSMPADFKTLFNHLAMVLEDTTLCGLIMAKKNVVSLPHKKVVQSSYTLILLQDIKQE